MTPARYWPLATGRMVTSPFGPRAGGFHSGVDFGWPGGSANKPVYAVQAGTVIYAGAAQGYGGPDPAGWLVIDSSTEQGGGCLEYGHIIREVAVGDRVAAGQRIGHINPNSNTNGGVAPHLHLSDMPYAYSAAAKQDPMPRLVGAKEPGRTEPPVTDALPKVDYGITKTMYGFNPTTPANATGNSNGPRAKTLYFVIHTQEGNGTAVSLANYLNGTRNVSYNLTWDANDTVEVVPVNQAPWAAAEANNIAVHGCFAGSFADWSRATWLSKNAALRRAAKSVAAACLQYDIPVVKVLSTGGWPVTPKGIAAHADFGKRGGGHTDPGVNFPWAEFLVMVQQALDVMRGAAVVPIDPTPMPVPVPAPTIDAMTQYVYSQMQPYPQLAGKPEALAELARKIDQGMDLTLVDAIAAHIHGLFTKERSA